MRLMKTSKCVSEMHAACMRGMECACASFNDHNDHPHNYALASASFRWHGITVASLFAMMR